MKLEKQYKCFGGTVSYYSHFSDYTKTLMRFSLFMPPNKPNKAVPYLLFLSGLTCSEDNFTTKAGAYKKASDLGVAILVPDTSPRGGDVPDHEDYDLGQGAGFYIDATQQPWSKNFQMESYIIKELIPLTENKLMLNGEARGIGGHSMGGHGALTLYFKYPAMFQSVSAFSPIVAPSQVPWGHKAFGVYLGENQDIWKQHDACELVRKMPRDTASPTILIDQGADDDFLEEQLKPELFEKACADVGQDLTLRRHSGYDHSYFFIQSFVSEHLEWHFG